MIWNIRKQKITSENRKKKDSERNKDVARSLWDNFEGPNICITEVPEGEEEEQEIGNQFEKIKKENFSNLVKKTDNRKMQVQEAKISKQDGLKEDHTKTHHN